MRHVPDSMKPSLRFRMVAGGLIAASTLLLSTSGAYAQASRTWVSGVGDDVNPCSRTAPGKTFAGAISKTAAAGEINVLDPGGFGAVTITKSITIDGSGGSIAGVLTNGTNGITVSAGANDVVTLRHLDIDGLTAAGSGIKINTAGEVNIEDCVIYEFGGKGIEIANTSGCRVNIINTIVRGCPGGAVSAHGAAGAVVTISKCHLLNSLYGYRGEDGSTATIEDTVAAGNVNNGILAVSSSTPALINLNNSTVTDNGVNGVVTSGANATIRMSLTTVSANGTGLSHPTGTIVSFGNNRVSGNSANGTPSSTTPLL